MKSEVLGVILARGGSKRIPDKNICTLGGKPLINYTVEQAIKAKLIDMIVISSDSDAILDTVKKNFNTKKLFFHKRTAEFSSDECSSTVSLIDVLNNFKKASITVLLQPTSPFRKSDYIDQCINAVLKEKYDSCETVKKCKEHPGAMFKIVQDECQYFNKIEFHDQSKRSPLYIENGAVYAIRTDVLRASNSLYSDRHKIIIMPDDESIDIDTPVDLIVAEYLLKRNKNGLDPDCP